MPDLTPMMQQYQKIKADVGDALLFFRLGDFYEMFGDDAHLASRELEITLTGRGQGESRSPMCGIPYHSAESYISKLIQRGYKVAICEQTEDPSKAQGLVKREVIKIVTPGTLVESALLNEKTNNFLIAFVKKENQAALSCIDISTAEFKIIDFGEYDKKIVFDEIERLSPKECLLSEDVFENDVELVSFLKSKNILLTKYNLKDIFDIGMAHEKLLKHFKLKTLEGFGINGNETSLCAASAIIDYLILTQKTSLAHINNLKKYQLDNFMHIDSATRRNLELVKTIRDNSTKGSLLEIIDKTKTPMGGRLLKSWLLFPLCAEWQINERLDGVQELIENLILRQDLLKYLQDVRDIERLSSKIACGSANARDLVSLRESLSKIPKIKGLLKSSISALLKNISKINDLSHVDDLISSSIVDDPPFILKEGGLIKKGFNKEIDEIKDASRKNKEWILNLEISEKNRTGIKSLKVGFTKVFGYYIEVSTPNLKYVPQEYIRKQTLVNCERFITQELKEKESLILNAQDRLYEMEYNIFCSIRDKIGESIKDLQNVAHQIALLDALLSLAETAHQERYVRPQINASNDDNLLIIKNGRHPVVEKNIGSHMFIPNDTVMDEENRFLLITGPNMAGKSTYMRQTALIVLLAQIGSFVPAESAHLKIVDRIFTRVGALDDLYAGQSTFMVEMLEVANILNNATSNSLIILDEIGRGTATFDGMSIACAVLEFIYSKIGAKTLFATHYHELTKLSERFDGIKNLNVLVKEEGENITFLHKIVDGPADKSYGIHVAKLAGLPAQVIVRAREIYDTKVKHFSA